MHIKELLVMKDVNYAASKSSATQETAHSPELLAEGAIGIYGEHTHANNGKHLSLITLNTTSEANNVYTVADSAFNGTKIFFALGTADSYVLIKSREIDLAGLKRIKGYSYSAPVKQKIAIGYNATSGDLNIPASFNLYDNINIKVIKVNSNPNSPDAERFSVKLDGNESDYAIAAKLLAQVRSQTLDGGQLLSVSNAGDLKIVSPDGGSALANSATVTAVYGAKSLATSAAHGVGVGDYVLLGGDLYQAVTGTTGSTLVLDRPYEGASGTVANANAKDLGATVPTVVGLVVTAKAVGDILKVAADGELGTNDYWSPTITTTVNGDVGIGSADFLLKYEAEAAPYQGSHDNITSYMPFPDSLVNKSANYDVYDIIYQNVDYPKGEQAKAFSVENQLLLAFPNDGSAAPANGVQSTTEIILETIYTATSGIIA